MILIAIIDQNAGRAQELAELIKPLDPRYRIFHFGRTKQWAEFVTDGRDFQDLQSPPPELRLCFWHYTNRPLANPSEYDSPLEPEGCNSVGKVWYGGNGPRYDLGFEWNINVAVGAGKDRAQFSPEKMHQVIEWCLNPGRDPNDIPELLRRGPVTEALPALAILCQGYLAAFAGSHIDQRSEDLNRALCRMRFSEMPRDFVDDIAKRFTEIRQRVWWKSPFEGTNLTSDAQTEAKDAGSSEIPKPILDLLEAIGEVDGQQTLGQSNNLSDNGSGKLLAEANLVARAFCEVENLLSKKSNGSLRPNETGAGASNNVTQGKGAT